MRSLAQTLFLLVLMLAMPVVAQQVQGTPEDPGATIIVLPSQSWGTWFGFYLLGLLGVVIRVGNGARKMGNTLDALTSYVKSTSLSVLLSFLMYTAVIAVWATTDMLQSLLGLYKGYLTGTSVFIGFGAEAIFKSMSKDVVGQVTKKIRDRNADQPDPGPQP